MFIAKLGQPEPPEDLLQDDGLLFPGVDGLGFPLGEGGHAGFGMAGPHAGMEHGMAQYSGDSGGLSLGLHGNGLHHPAPPPWESPPAGGDDTPVSGPQVGRHASAADMLVAACCRHN